MAIAIGFLKTLLELADARKTGALDAQGPTARVRIFVSGGQIIYAEEGGVAETLGRILLRERVLTEDQYTIAIEWMAEAVARGKVVKLGEVLTQLGMLTNEQLLAALSAQVRHKVVRALGWSPVHVSFFECHGQLMVDGAYPTSLEPLVLAAVRAADPVDVEDLFAQARSRFVSLRGDKTAGGGPTRRKTIARLAKFQLSKVEDTLARGLDGSRTIGELVKYDGAVVIGALLLTDCLDLHTAAQAPKLERRTSSGNMPALKPSPIPRPSVRPPASSVDGSAGLDDTKSQRRGSRPPGRVTVRPPSPVALANAQRATKKLRAAREAKQQRLLPPPMPNAVPRTTTFETAAAPASVAPMGSLAKETPTTPVEPLAPMARLLAEKAFQAGRKHARVNAMKEAATELRHAAQLYAAPEYQLWAAWATLRSEPERAKERLSDLREAAERALDDDPDLGFGWYALSFTARNDGDMLRAAELLERARMLDPDAVELAHDVQLKPGTPQAFLAHAKMIMGMPLTMKLPTAMPPLPPLSSPPMPVAVSVETRGELRALAPPMITPAGAATARDYTASDSSSALRVEERKEEKRQGVASGEASTDSRGIGSPPILTHTIPSEVVPRARGGALALGGAILVAVAAIGAGVLWLRSSPAKTDGPVPPSTSSAPVVTSAVVTAPVPVAAVAVDASVAPTMSASASGELAESGRGDVPVQRDTNTAIPVTQGALEFSKRAAGHRVFVDGRVVGEPPDPMLVSCGKHLVKVGSRGTEREVLVPCGGRVNVPFP